MRGMVFGLPNSGFGLLYFNMEFDCVQCSRNERTTAGEVDKTVLEKCTRLYDDTYRTIKKIQALSTDGLRVV